MLVVSMIAEARLRKIGSDPDGFNQRERKTLRDQRSQEGRWLMAVDLAFRRQYAIPYHEDVDSSHRDQTVVERYTTLNKLIREDLKLIIEDRNKLAHGQWAWLLNSDATSFTRPAPDPLNYQAIKRRNQVVTHLANIVNDLVVSEPTFQRDFDDSYAQVLVAQAAIEGQDYELWAAGLRYPPGSPASSGGSHHQLPTP